MNLKNLKRILQPGNVLAATDISPDDKKQLYKVMQKMGATDSFSYTRYFRDGFDSWEIDGVVALKTAFLEWLQTKEKIFLEVRNVGRSRWRHFYRIPPAPAEGQDFTEHDFDIMQPGDFWRFLGDIGYRKRFGEFMAERGMKSYHTVIKRFSSDDWREWERIGIRSVVEGFDDDDSR